MKLRILAVGIVEMILSIVLYIVRGYHPAYLGLLVIGVVLIVFGLLRK